MKKKTWILIALIIGVLLIGAGIFFYFNNNNSSKQEEHYEADRTSATNSTNETNENNANLETQNPETNSTNEVRQGIAESETNPPPVTEEQIATFTTKIYSSDSARQNNISITCNTLNGTIVKKGETFSFCGTVGQASSNKGYQKADIFDKNGNKKKGLGGRKLPN